MVPLSYLTVIWQETPASELGWQRNVLKRSNARDKYMIEFILPVSLRPHALGG